MIEMKIRDEELETLGSNINNMTKQIEGQIQGLIKCLTMVCQYGISSGDFHNNLELYIEVLKTLQGEATRCAIKSTNKIRKYLEQLDNIDGALY